MRRAAIAASLLVAATAGARPRGRAEPQDADVSDCGAAPSADAAWFYLGAPGDRPGAAEARRALRAIDEAFEGGLRRDPRCLHVEIVDHGTLGARYKALGSRGPQASVVGFHNRKLGADTTVFVQPRPGQGLDVVIVHEVLHALSHRFAAESGQRRLAHLDEGATEFLTREVAEASLGIPRKSFKTGYGKYLFFWDVLMRRLGKDALPLLGSSYFADGYDAFETEVDSRLGIELRPAAHALERDDLREAVQRLSTPAARAGDGTAAAASAPAGGR